MEWEKAGGRDLLSSDLTSVSDVLTYDTPPVTTVVSPKAHLQPIPSPFAGWAAKATAGAGEGTTDESDTAPSPRHRRVTHRL